MKRLAVIGPRSPRTNWIENLIGRLQPRPKFVPAISSLGNCDGLLVVDDGSRQGLDAILNALALRKSNPGLQVAVVTSFDADWSDSECLARAQSYAAGTASDSLRIDTIQIQRLMRAHDSEFEMRIATDAITFEFQG